MDHEQLSQAISRGVRKGNVNSKFNEDKDGIIFAEIFVLSVLAGLALKSWGWGATIFFAFCILINFRWFAYGFIILTSLFWAYLGGAIAWWCFSAFHKDGLPIGCWVFIVLLSFFIFSGAFFTRQRGLQQLKDMVDEEDV